MTKKKAEEVEQVDPGPVYDATGALARSNNVVLKVQISPIGDDGDRQVTVKAMHAGNDNVPSCVFTAPAGDEPAITGYRISRAIIEVLALE